MIVDGNIVAKKVYEQIRAAVRTLPRAPTLAVVRVGNDSVTERFVRVKFQRAKEVGIAVREEYFDAHVEEERVADALKRLGADTSVDGIVLQLPLPAHLSVDRLIARIPVAKDIDALSHNSMAKFRTGELPILPPVAAAIQAILEFSGVEVMGKDVLIIGHGRLVGAPAALLMRHNHAHLTVIDRPVANLTAHTKEADIVISGAGTAGLIRPEMLKRGAVLIDAGTSEQSGTIVGDATADCATVCSVFTPVPGGVGPVTVAMLLKNCVIAAKTVEIENKNSGAS